VLLLNYIQLSRQLQEDVLRDSWIGYRMKDVKVIKIQKYAIIAEGAKIVGNAAFGHTIINK